MSILNIRAFDVIGRRLPGNSTSVIIILSIFVTSMSTAQLRLSGQASSAFIKAEAGQSQYAINSGRATFAWRLDLFADAAISEKIFFLGNLRVMQDQIFHIDLFELKIADIASSGTTLELGEIELPFGILGEHRFPKSNPFYSLPLMYEHLTTLRSSAYSLWLADARYTIAGDGVRILDQGLYDIGAKLSGEFGIFDYSLAVVNGMLSSTSIYSSTYSSSGLNSKKGFGTIVRLAATPVTGLTMGTSFATGPFLREELYYSLPAAYNPSDLPQRALEGDLDFSYGHFAFLGEIVYNEWKFEPVLGSDLIALCYTVEGRYTPLPRVTLALRAGGLHFNDLTFGVPMGYGYQEYTEPWDHDVFRLESACGFRIDRDVLVKVMYEWNNSIGMPVDPADNVFVVQAVVSF